MTDEFEKLAMEVQAYKKMVISLAKYSDKLDNDIDSIKKAVEGFDGRMLIMAVRVIGLQERIKTIDESLQKVISHILEKGNGYKQEDAEEQSSTFLQRKSILRSIEYEQALSQFNPKLEGKNKENIARKLSPATDFKFSSYIKFT